MSGIAELQRQHQTCDQQINQCETALHQKDVTAAKRFFQQANFELTTHLDLEEERLFPALEKIMGSSNGPTSVMRHEHAEIRNLCTETIAALEASSIPEALAHLDTLGVLIQQHNVKEENILYPMAERSIPNLETLLGLNSACCGKCTCN